MTCRVGLIAPSHWHYPLYRPALSAPGARIVGVCDPSPALAQAVAAEFGCAVYDGVSALLARARPDFVFAFGVHARMPAIAQALIARRIPFSIEKPCGLTGDDVARVRRQAEEAGLFVSVPFHYRLSRLAAVLADAATLPSPDFLHVQCAVHGGSPERFTASSPWLADPESAGGGCLMNLGHHPVDLLWTLTGSAVVSVQATLSDKALGLAVEDYAAVSLKMADGSVAAIETSYTQPLRAPDYMDFQIAVGHRAFTAKREGDALALLDTATGQRRRVDGGWRFKDYFADYVHATLARAAAGQPPVAGLRDLERTMRIVDAAYRSAREGRAVAPEPMA